GDLVQPHVEGVPGAEPQPAVDHERDGDAVAEEPSDELQPGGRSRGDPLLHFTSGSGRTRTKYAYTAPDRKSSGALARAPRTPPGCRTCTPPVRRAFVGTSHRGGDMGRYGRDYGGYRGGGEMGRYDRFRYGPGGPGWGGDRGVRWGGGGRGRYAPSETIQAADIMTPNPEAVTPDTPLSEVAGRMRDLDVG